jgi:REP element-mobilizing transposase RayT
MRNYPVRKRKRLENHDYSHPGFYYITICTKNRENYFGKITENGMELSDMGNIVKQHWLKIPENFNDVDLDLYTIMPNHIHGIIIIKNDVKRIRNRQACSLQKRNHQKLPVIIGSFKSGVTRTLNEMSQIPFFSWQKSYYDRIIRNNRELDKIREYIKNNPVNWRNDRDNKENLS